MILAMSGERMAVGEEGRACFALTLSIKKIILILYILDYGTTVSAKKTA